MTLFELKNINHFQLYLGNLTLLYLTLLYLGKLTLQDENIR